MAVVPTGADGAGDTTSEGVGAVHEYLTWPFDYLNPLVSVTGVGDTTSSGVGSASVPQVWPFDYWDGVNAPVGAGNNLSAGVGAATALVVTWYDIGGTALGAPAAAGAGNTTSAGVGAALAIDPIVSVTGSGNTLSEAGGIPLSTVVPPGGIRLTPYWEPGELVYCYLLWQWLGSYEARLGAGAGPVVSIGVADADSTVAFGGLEPGQYVAVAGRKRVHFMVTP